MMKIRLFGALLLLGVSCQSNERPSDTKARDKATFDDVPAPEGFDYTEGSGYTNSSFRSYKQEYRGQQKPEEILTFYRDKMKFFKWELKSETGAVPNPVVLSFLKGVQRCDVEVKLNPQRDTIVTIVQKYHKD